MPSNAAAVAAELVALGGRTKKATEAVTRHYGQLLEAQVKANASGRPGPRVVTGQYRASINTIYGYQGGDFVASVGSNAPQARRLELGFVGTDSRGRHYAQGPLPHFKPAADKIGPQFAQAVARAVVS